MSVEAQANLEDFLRAHGLAEAHEKAEWTALTGGVSSEIWRVDLPGRSLCVKRALPKLKVVGNWEAPISRNGNEWRWLCFAAQHQPQAVPRPLAHDERAGLFAMSFLAPEQYSVWKEQLLKGAIDEGVAEQVGVIVASLHNASAGRSDLAREFATLDNFEALRLEPYFVATSTRHPEVANELLALAERTASIGLALVHGDVSPKNILIGREGPVMLDAECAWYGDPAFDLAFCLNHLLLKSLLRPTDAPALLRCFSRLTESYFERVVFEPRRSLEERIAELLPALLLARVDGKSPVEYLANRLPEQDLVRRVSCALLKAPVVSLRDIPSIWEREIKVLPPSN